MRKIKRALFYTQFELIECDSGLNTLPYLIREVLIKNFGYSVDVIKYDGGRNPVSKRLMQLGLFFRKSRIDFDQYSLIVTFPEVLINNVPSRYWRKIMTFGPDASSLVHRRMYKNNAGFKKFLHYIYMKIHLCHENKLLNGIWKWGMVGRNDRRWIRQLAKDRHEVEKVYSYTHPLLESSLVNFKSHFCFRSTEKRFVFSGDLNVNYVGKFIDDLAFYITELGLKVNVLVLGKKNYWIKKILEVKTECKIEYMEWVDSYQDVCRIGIDVHCIPLLTGGGTKNRTLTAIANGLTVITTRIGIENINFLGGSEIYISATPKKFAENMLKVHKTVYTEEKINRIINERECFRRYIRQRFREDIIYMIQNNSSDIDAII